MEYETNKQKFYYDNKVVMFSIGFSIPYTANLVGGAGLWNKNVRTRQKNMSIFRITKEYGGLSFYRNVSCVLQLYTTKNI